MAEKKNGHNGLGGNGHKKKGKRPMAALATTDDPTPASGKIISVRESLRKRHILMTGATGFLGKVVASMLLTRHPDIEHLYLVVRGNRSHTAQERFDLEIKGSPVFQPLRDAFDAGFDAFIADKVTVLDGDVAKPNYGITDKKALRKLRSKLDLIINSAGLTSFTPSLEMAIGVNTHGPLGALAFAQSCKKAALAHVSTTYVSGLRDGFVREDEDPVGFYPRRKDLKITFDPAQELADCKRAMEAIYIQADDQERQALYTRMAHNRLEADGRDPDDKEAFDALVSKERKKWIRETLREEGVRRADHWGWTNTYTYAKSLGEQLLTRTHREDKEKDGVRDVPLCIIRPSIIESSLEFPFPGWNQGINTCAPLTYLVSKGIRFIPTKPGVRLDVVPVDYVASGMLIIGAALIAQEHEHIYQLATSQRNPVSVERLVELTTLAKRQHNAKKVSISQWEKLASNILEGMAVDKKRYERISAPIVRKTASGIQKSILGFGKTGIGGLDSLLKGVRKTARTVEKQAKLVETILDLFMPFIHDASYIFQADAVRRLEAMLPPEEAAWGFQPEALDWRDYWLRVQMPGLQKHAFPELDAKLGSTRKEIYTPKDLMEVFASSTGYNEDRVAFQRITTEGVERYTYGQFKEKVAHFAHNIVAGGLSEDDRVLIMSENRPEWGMTYFGLLQANAAAVPCDSELDVHAVVNLARSAHAYGIVASPKVAKRLKDGGLKKALAALAREKAGPGKVKLMTFDDLLIKPAKVDEASLALVPADSADRVASLIFTSGTTGNPKGVMLAHRNFTSLLASMNQVFDVSQKDTFLSVLPLHHTFEFTCGFLMPLSRGATITYLDKLDSDSLNQAFNQTTVTAMIGVPALWQLLHRRIMSQVSEKGPAARTGFDAMLALNRWLRERFRLNMGRTIFAPVHKKFGGRIRYLISGGASLPAPIMETFHGLGFELLEGYGLTEASPVLTCGRPGTLPKIGSVGKPLPGVEVEIRDPDGAGVGEIVARGGNVMIGYFSNKEATDAVLDEDGWLRTGDLGRLDKKGHLYIAGRQKEMIVAANGENVYPDELEEVLEGCDYIEELSVVGIPDEHGSERVASMVRPALPEDGSVTREEAIAEIRKHFDLKAARLPYHQRIKILRFTDEPLPRTATRKVKRKEVVQMFLALESASGESGTYVARTEARSVDWGEQAWLRDSAASVAGLEPKRIGLDDAMIDDMGFDSLAFTELASAIEAKTGRKLTTDELIGAGSLRQVAALIETTPEVIDERDDSATATGFGHLPPSMRPQVARHSGDKSTTTQLGDMLEVPEPMRKGLKGALGQAQSWVYNDLFDVRITGKGHLPYHTNAIVAANHCSHLDMGLVKSSLSDWAPNLSTLAASDYFFDTKAKRTYFGQFTNLIPVERTGSLDAMSAIARKVQFGEQLLLFPEGTRSTTGDLADFRPGLGYLVMKSRTGVLPVYLGGTYRVLPKGAAFPRQRRMRVHIGEMIPFEFFQEKTKDMSPRESYLEVSRLVREAIMALKAGRRFLDQGEDGKPSKEQARGDMLARLFADLGDRFVENQVDEQVSFYFSLGGEDSDKWTLVVNPHKCFITPGKPTDGRADCVVKTTPEMFQKMVIDSYVPSFDEFMSGQIKTNDPNLLMAFQNVFGF